MPANVFAALGEEHYGPQYLHNVAFLCGDGRLARMADGWLQALRGDRRIGAAVTGRCAGEDAECVAVMSEVGVDISESELSLEEELEPEDFDIAIVLAEEGGRAHELVDDDWRRRSVFLEWRCPLQDWRAAREELRARVADLLLLLDDKAVRAAVGPGVSC